MLIKFLSQGLVLEIVKNLGMAERLVGLVPFVPYSIQFLSQGQVLNVVKISAWLRGWLVGTMVSEAGDLRSVIKDVRSVNPDNSLESSDVRGVCCTTPDSGRSPKSKQKICEFAYFIPSVASSQVHARQARCSSSISISTKKV